VEAAVRRLSVRAEVEAAATLLVEEDAAVEVGAAVDETK
jgi:hypothetical protein